VSDIAPVTVRRRLPPYLPPATSTVLNNFTDHLLALRAFKRALIVVRLVRLDPGEPHPPSTLRTNRLREHQTRRVECICLGHGHHPLFKPMRELTLERHIFEGAARLNEPPHSIDGS
jgi:hypothetical protein